MPAPVLALLALVLTATPPGEPPDEAPADEASAPTRRYVMEQLRLEGLVHTKASEVRRHISMAEGEVLDEKAVELSRLRLLQLGWFSRVETRVERGTSRGLVVLVFDFTERSTLVVSDFVLGSTPPQPLYGGIGLAEGNFLGLGLGLSGAFVYGGTPAEEPWAPARFALRGSFFDPELVVGDTRLVGGISLLFARGEEFACTDPDCSDARGHYDRAPRLRYERLGGELNFGFRPGTFERLLAGYRLERVSGTAILSATVPQGTLPSLHLGTSILTALTASYERDTRNDFFLATDGTRLNLNITFGSQELGGDYEYSRYLLQVESNHALPHGHALRLLGAAGAVQGDAPFFERFYAADFAYFSIGPALGRALELNFSTDDRYDSYLAMLGTEYAIPLWTGGRFFYRGYVALGARWLYTAAYPRASRTTASKIPFSGDVALRLDTPVGSFNVSLAYALDNFL